MRRSLSFVSAFFVLVSILTSAPSSAQQGDLSAILKRFNEFYGLGNYTAALVEAQKLEKAVKARFGTNHANYAVALSNLAIVYIRQGKYAEAEGLNRRALTIYEKARGPNHPDVALALSNLAALYRDQSRYAEAEPLARRALAIYEKAHGPDHPDVAIVLANLATLYRNQARYADAEPLARRVLAIYEKMLGPGHPAVAMALASVASLSYNQGRYAEAELLYRRALTIDEKTHGPNHLHVAATLDDLAALYYAQGRYADAEPFYQRVLAIREKASGPDHPDVATALNNLAVLYRNKGRYADAEPLYKRAVAIREKMLGPDHPYVAASLSGLAVLYRSQGRYADAEPLYGRAVAINEKALGPDHPDVALSLSNLAVLHYSQGRYADAEPLYRRALAINEKAFGPDHPDVALSLNNLAVLYGDQGRYADAEPLYQRALMIREKARGPDHPDVAESLFSLAALYDIQNRYADAEPLLKRSLAIWEKALGENHPNVARTLNNLALVVIRRGDIANALAWTRRATAAVIAHAHAEAGAPQKSGAGGLIEQRADYFRNHVVSLVAAARQRIEPEAALVPEGFEVAQWAVQSTAAAALTQMAARQAKGEGVLAKLVRQRQDLQSQWHAADQRLNAALGRGDGKLADELRLELSSLDAKFVAIDARLAKEFPDYAALSSPKPLSIGDTQALLDPDEALFLTLDTAAGPFVWLVTKNDARWRILPLAASAIADKVQALRCGLDLEGEWRWSDEKSRWYARKKACEAIRPDGLAVKELPPFDLAVSHELYETLFGSFKDVIQGKRLLIVTSGALASLPLHVLVTDKPETAVPMGSDYRGVTWLGQRHAISVLPSVTSLKALREHAKVSAAGKPYLGIGNPLLSGPSGTDQTASRRQSCPAASPGLATQVIARSGRGVDTGKLLRGGLADLALLRQQQPLPETADELCEVGRSLTAAPGDILLGGKATERTVKSLSASGALAGYRVLHFATHGLLPQETASIAAGLTEAALLLTPPGAASDEDDGLLTASEVTLLKLNADWVIMSACNTGGGDQSGEALSGLARAFFYAGARALLVSHWYVDSASAVALTTKTFDEMKRDPKLGRAEALRRAMQALIASGGRFAHPANWAPFVVVGEGAAR